MSDGRGGTDTLISIEQIGVTGTTFADTITGGATDDQIVGGDGDDTLIGGAGNDNIFASSGKLNLSGGDGDDRISIDVTSYVGALPNRINAVVDGGSGTDTLTVNYGGFAPLTMSNVNGVISASSADTFIVVQAQGVESISVTGSVGGDTLVGGSGADSLLGIGGNDTISGGAGNDFISGGDGNDRLDGGAGDDVVSGGAGDDLLDGGAGVDRYAVERRGAFAVGQTYDFSSFDVSGATFTIADGLGGRDTLSNFEGVQISASDGNDTLIGSAGADTLSGGLGADTVRAGAGDDLLMTGGETSSSSPAVQGGDTFDGGDGFDTLSFTGVQSNVTADLQAGTASSSGIGNDTLVNVEALTGGSGADTLRGNGGANTLDGGAGDDVLTGRGGADTLTGGTGADTFVFAVGDSTAAARDVITDFQSGVDRLDLSGTNATTLRLVQVGDVTRVVSQGSTGAETQIDVRGVIKLSDIGLGGAIVSGDFLGTDGPDVLVGSAGNDQLFGFGSADRLDGGAGDDLLFGDAGADTLTGGAGADRFAYRAVSDSNATDGSDTITDFVSGTDKLDLTYLNGVTSVSLVRSNGGTIAFASTATGQLQVAVGAALQGTDLINPFGSASTFGYDLVGGAADERLIGSSGNDKLFGLGGSDTLDGGAGDDQLFGDAGADVLTGGAGADRFAYRSVSDSNATSGFDIITDFVSGTDKLDFSYLNGVTGVSLVRSGGATFVFAAAAGGLVQVGVTTAVQGGDLISPFGAAASFGYDMVGEAIGERLTGSGGNDRIYGLGGNDVIDGGAGNDILYGDAGADLLTGGAGPTCSPTAPRATRRNRGSTGFWTSRPASISSTSVVSTPLGRTSTGSRSRARTACCSSTRAATGLSIC